MKVLEISQMAEVNGGFFKKWREKRAEKKKVEEAKKEESSPSPGMTREEGVATCKKVGWAAKLNPFTKKAGFLCEGTVNVIKNKQESDRALIDSLGQ